MTDARKKATELARQAVEADHAGQVRQAKQLYESACTYFVHALKYDKSLSAVGRELVQTKLDEYLTRGEALKVRLDEAEQAARDVEAKQPVPRRPVATPADSRQAATREGAAGPEESGTRLAEPPATRWTDVAGLGNVKRELHDAVVLPQKLPHFFAKGHGRKPAAGILLYGPPGTGKTLVARALAGECQRAFFAVSTADVIDKYVGESAQKLRRLFEEARTHRPSIIFIDEIETLCQARGGNANASEASQQVVSEFLRQLDGVGPSMDDVLLLGATNLPEALDAAMRRRFTRRIYVPLPDTSTRAAILRVQLAKVPHEVSDAELHALAEATAGYSAADLAGVVQWGLTHTLHMVTEATHFASAVPDAPAVELWRPCSPGEAGGREVSFDELDPATVTEPPVRYRYLAAALQEIRPNVTAADCAKYEEFSEKYGTGRA